MKLYYSTYGMQKLDVFKALPRLRDMGYEGMEIAVTPGWATDPMHFDSAERKKLAALFNELDFPTPPLMALLSPCVIDDARPPMLSQFAATFDMARDLRGSDEPAVVTTTLGHGALTGSARFRPAAAPTSAPTITSSGPGVPAVEAPGAAHPLHLVAEHRAPENGHQHLARQPGRVHAGLDHRDRAHPGRSPPVGVGRC